MRSYPIDSDTTYGLSITPDSDTCEIDVRPKHGPYQWPEARLVFHSLDNLTGFIEELESIAAEWQRAQAITAEAEARELEDEQRCHDMHLKRGGVR